MTQICAIWEYIIELFNLGGKTSAQNPRLQFLWASQRKNENEGQESEAAANLF